MSGRILVFRLLRGLVNNEIPEETQAFSFAGTIYPGRKRVHSSGKSIGNVRKCQTLAAEYASAKETISIYFAGRQACAQMILTRPFSDI